MKSPFSTPIFIAAMTAVAAMLNTAPRKNSDAAPAPVDPHDATTIPPMTPAQVQKYAYLGATDTDIADRFLVDELVIRTQFASYLRSARGLRRIMLHSYQMDLAKKANASMLTWIGRNELGQSLAPQKPGEPDPVITDDACAE